MNTESDPERNDTTRIKNLPDGPRRVFSVLFLGVSLILLLSVADFLVENYFITIRSMETDAKIVNKKTAYSKSGYGYYVDYEFSVDTRDFSRTRFWGLFKRDSRVTKHEYDSLDIGSTIKVVYSKMYPFYNRPKEMGNENSTIIWQILGMVVFGGIAVNELKNLRKKKQSGV